MYGRQDGGFDFSSDYITRYNFMRLFLCEVILALKLQKKMEYL